MPVKFLRQIIHNLCAKWIYISIELYIWRGRAYPKEGMNFIMNIDERKGNMNSSILQNIVLENREKLSISGVNDILSFDDQIVILETQLGLLTVKGENLRINKLSTDSEEVTLEGDITSLSYSEKDIDRKSGSFISKIFK